MLQAAAKLAPDYTAGGRRDSWGGKRPKTCPDHPDAPVVRRTLLSCSECGQVLAEQVDRLNCHLDVSEAAAAPDSKTDLNCHPDVSELPSEMGEQGNTQENGVCPSPTNVLKGGVFSDPGFCRFCGRPWNVHGAADVFGPGGSNGAAAPAVDVKSLHAKIGELTLENDFLEGALSKAGLLSARR